MRMHMQPSSVHWLTCAGVRQPSAGMSCTLAWGGRAPDGSGKLGQHAQRLFQDARLIQRHHELIHLRKFATLAHCAQAGLTTLRARQTHMPARQYMCKPALQTASQMTCTVWSSLKTRSHRLVRAGIRVGAGAKVQAELLQQLHYLVRLVLLQHSGWHVSGHACRGCARPSAACAMHQKELVTSLHNMRDFVKQARLSGAHLLTNTGAYGVAKHPKLVVKHL